MPKIFTSTCALDEDIVDAFCLLQKGFTDQFVYYDKDYSRRVMGLGRCVALSTLAGADYIVQGSVDMLPFYFSFNRFDAENPKPSDDMMEAFPRLHYMLPEVVLIEDETGAYLQVNSLGPVYEGRVKRFKRHAAEAAPRTRRTISFELTRDSFEQWDEALSKTLDYIHEGRIEKLVPSRRLELHASEPFSSKDLLVNLIDSKAPGKVFLYRYGDVFFCGCTPELLVRKHQNSVESMCLAGTTAMGTSDAESTRLGEALMNDAKNRREHEYVVSFMREVFRRNCFDVDIPQNPTLMKLKHIQHLYTPAKAHVMEGRSLSSLVSQLHPTPALSGTPVGEAMMCLREIEAYNRGFFGGAVGYVNGNGDGEFAVAIRSGVFDGERGWIYAGCGVVEGSNARSEFDEIDLKFKTILGAFSAES